MQIRLQKLKKTYESPDKTRVTAVNGITLDIPENRIFGIIGKSGAGKSSLVRLVSLLETPDEGEIYFSGRRVDNSGKKALIAERRKIGMIFQNFNLFSSRTAGQNVAYPLEICGTPKKEIEKRVNEMLAMVGLEDRINAPISTLSGGQKQRVAIARALSTKPEILLCDEATSALDPQTTRSILELIRKIQKQMNLTVVMITHQMEVVRDACEFVAVVEKGKVVEQGSVKEIFINPKSEIVREFVFSGKPDGEKNNEFVRLSSKGGNYSIKFIGDKADMPLLSMVCKKFDIEINIRAGGIQNLSEEKIGIMLVDFIGENSEIEKAVEWLKSQGLIVEKFSDNIEGDAK